MHKCPSVKCFFTECDCWCKMSCVLGSFVLLLLRLYFGWHFLMAGKGKFMNTEQVTGFFTNLAIPFPHIMVYVVAAIEMIGGAFLLIGLAARFVSIPLSVTMIVAFFTAHLEAVKNIFKDPETFFAQDPFLFLLTTLLVLSFGPGMFSIDYVIKKKCCQSDVGSSGTKTSCCS